VGGHPLSEFRVSGLFWWLIVAAAVAYVYWAGGVRTVWYAAQYKVATAEVHVDGKPGDCDFMYAPLGEKGCHYESTWERSLRRLLRPPRYKVLDFNLSIWRGQCPI
jgi:hypothetical protein